VSRRAGPPMSQFGQERTCILSHDWAVNGQVPLTYEPLPTIDCLI
jgi:hypothetical protein